MLLVGGDDPTPLPDALVPKTEAYSPHGGVRVSGRTSTSQLHWFPTGAERQR